MQKLKNIRSKQSGFTVIELLVVIVVIGILVTLTVVNYNGIQARSRDTIVKNAAKQLAVELLRFSSDTGKTPVQTGAGWQGSGTGFVSSQYTDPTNYPIAVETVLVNGGYLPSGFTAALPKNTKYNGSAYTLMLYACGLKYIIYYSLEAPTTSDISDFNNNIVPACSNATTVQTNYNMQGGYIFS